MPVGRATARDGRSFLLDEPEAVLAAFDAGGIDLPLDYEHQNDRPEAKLSGPVPAAGWIKELSAPPRSLGHWTCAALMRQALTPSLPALSPPWAHLGKQICPSGRPPAMNAHLSPKGHSEEVQLLSEQLGGIAPERFD